MDSFSQCIFTLCFWIKENDSGRSEKDALTWMIIYAVLFVVSFIPFIGWLASLAMMVIFIYYSYRLFYRWTGESGKALLFVILTIVTFSIFFYVYGLIKMKQEFVAE